MSDMEDRDVTPPDQPRRSPGAELKRAREAKKLSLDAVSENTGIPRSVLQALEEDDWARLDAPVYVRGYLRKYARLLELDGEDLVAGYEAAALPSDPEIHSYVSEHLPVQRNVGWLLPVTSIIVVAVIVLVGLWGWHHFRSRMSHKEAPASAVSAMMALTNAGAAHAKPSSSGSGVAVPAMRTVAAGASASAAAPGLKLEMQLDKPSWIEVYGAGHKRLYYNLAPAGKQLDFHARKGALTVFLGNAAGVHLKVNGKDYTVPAADISGNTARFEIPAHPQQTPPAGTRQ